MLIYEIKFPLNMDPLKLYTYLISKLKFFNKNFGKSNEKIIFLLIYSYIPPALISDLWAIFQTFYFPYKFYMSKLLYNIFINKKVYTSSKIGWNIFKKKFGWKTLYHSLLIERRRLTTLLDHRLQDTSAESNKYLDVWLLSLCFFYPAKVLDVCPFCSASRPIQ